MTRAELAYQVALRQIKEAAETHPIRLDLRIPDLDRLPPEIANLTALKALYLTETRISDLTHLTNFTALKALYLSETHVSDLAHIANLTKLETLGLFNTQVSDLAHIANLTKLENLGLFDTQVSDLRPVLKCRNIISTEKDRGLYFRGSLATQVDPELDRLSKILDVHDRTQQTFAYLETLPPYPDPLPWDIVKLPKKQPPLSVEAVLNVQDNAGWRFSPYDTTLSLYIVNTPPTEQQFNLSKITQMRIDILLFKLGKPNTALGLRNDVIEEASRFKEILEDDSRTLSERSLEMWSSLITLGSMLEGNDIARVEGRDPLDLLTVEMRAALQGFISIAGNFVRSFSEARDLDAGQSAFSRQFISSKLILAIIEKALNAKLIDMNSAAVMQHVEHHTDGHGTQAEKAARASQIGTRNMLLAAAVFAMGGAGVTATNAVIEDIVTDISNHYEWGEQSIELIEATREFFSSSHAEVDEFIDGLSPDERANIKAAIEDLKSGPDRI